jgi:tRNA A37 threonylcarbamoyltransferase TsaD
MPDFNYTFDGFWYHLIPLNSQAEEAWRQIETQFSGGVVPESAWKSTASQLRGVGYSVKKARATKMDDVELLAELGF